MKDTTMQGVRFSSHIRFVSHEELLRRAKGTRECTLPRRQVGGHTHGVRMCNAGGIRNSEQMILYHLLPWQPTLDKVLLTMKCQIARLKQDQKPMSGLITGGQGEDDASVILRSRLKALYEGANIPYSLIWGQKRGGETAFTYSQPEDTWYVHTKIPGEDWVNSPEKLAEAYEHIVLSPADDLAIGEVAVSPEELMQIKESKALRTQRQTHQPFAGLRRAFTRLVKIPQWLGFYRN